MSALVAWFHDPAHRAYVYRVLGALGLLLGALGVVSSDEAAQVLLFVGTVLGLGGTGLATLNTSTKAQG